MKTVLFKNGIKLEVSQNTAETIADGFKIDYEFVRIWGEDGSLLRFFVLSEIVAIY